MAYTRLSLDGYGAKRAGSFVGKQLSVSSTHPVGKITRLSLDGYGARRTGVFGGKEDSDHGGMMSGSYIPVLRPRRR